MCRVVQQRSTMSGEGPNSNAPTKRGGGGGFKQLAQRKSDATQPVVLVSMTRRPSCNSGQWKPFKWKSSDLGEQRRASIGGGSRPELQHQQTNVDLQRSVRPETVTIVPEGRVNAAFVPDRLQNDVWSGDSTVSAGTATRCNPANIGGPFKKLLFISHIHICYDALIIFLPGIW